MGQGIVLGQKLKEAIIARWFGESGGGIQYKLSKNINELSVYLEEVSEK